MLNWGKNGAVNAYAPIGDGAVEGCQGLLMRAENNWQQQFLLENSVRFIPLVLCRCAESSIDLLRRFLLQHPVPRLLFVALTFFMCLCTRLLVYLPGKQIKTSLSWAVSEAAERPAVISPGSGERVQRKLLLPPPFFFACLILHFY